ncbi:MAG: hypothetical protein FWH43_07875 [Endomicrobia bacterium]|nr:hypothetical protein [Endomicrobiia bacterium]
MKRKISKIVIFLFFIVFTAITAFAKSVDEKRDMEEKYGVSKKFTKEEKKEIKRLKKEMKKIKLETEKYGVLPPDERRIK